MATEHQWRTLKRFKTINLSSGEKFVLHTIGDAAVGCKIPTRCQSSRFSNNRKNGVYGGVEASGRPDELKLPENL